MPPPTTAQHITDSPPASPVTFPLTATPPEPTPSSPLPSSSSLRVRHYAPSSGAAFSRSAAKRHSVMALPSIEHLQHQYAKLGLTPSLRRGPPRPSSSSKPTLTARQGWSILPGMGGSGSSSLHSSGDHILSEEPEEDAGMMSALPPSPVKPEMDTRQPWEREGVRAGRSVKDEKSLRNAVFAGLEVVCDRWSLVPSTASRRRSSAFRKSLDLVLPMSPSFASDTLSPASDRARSPEPSAASAGGGDTSLDSARPFSPTLHSSLHALSASVASDVSSMEGNLVYELIRTTTDAVRAVQNYVVALPPGALLDGEQPSAKGPQQGAETEAVRLSTASRPRSSVVRMPSLADLKEVKSPKAADSAQKLRTAGIDVLGALKDMEHRYRLHTTPPQVTAEGAEKEEDEAEDVPGLSASMSSGSLSGSGSAPPALGAASEYASGVALTELRREAEIVRVWVEVVDKVLLRRKVQQKGGALAKRASFLIESRQGSLATPPRQASSSTTAGAGAGEADDSTLTLTPPKLELHSPEDQPLSDSDFSSSDDTEIPLWADPEAFPASRDGILARAHILLAHHLPPNLHDRLPDTADRGDLLYALADGVLLCHAYNTVLRVSSRPFGFIPQPDIHALPPPAPREEVVDTVRAGGASGAAGLGHGKEASSSAGGEGEKVGQTFRRIDNLRVFVAALRFRYHVTVPKEEWDVKRVARKEEGWEEMLEGVVGRWVERAAEERREEMEEE